MFSSRRPLLRGGFLFALLTALVLAAAPAGADHGSVTVTLDVSAGEPAATVPWARCALTVDHGDDGVAVLDAAVAAGCIDSYETSEDPNWGTFLECIDQICGAPAEAMRITYWRMSVDGQMTSYGIDGYEAADGDVLGFSYSTWGTCLTPIGC